MTPSELKYKTLKTSPEFFTRKTMQFFGDTMRNYGVRSAVIDTHTRKQVGCWELWRKRPVSGGQSSAYFAKDSFEHVLEAIRGNGEQCQQ